MDPRQFDLLLEKVKSAIENASEVDEKGRRLLERLDQDIHALLNKTEEVGAPSINQRLREAIRHFEVTHPTLTALLSEISAILSNAGI